MWHLDSWGHHVCVSPLHQGCLSWLPFSARFRRLPHPPTASPPSSRFPQAQLLQTFWAHFLGALDLIVVEEVSVCGGVVVTGGEDGPDVVHAPRWRLHPTPKSKARSTQIWDVEVDVADQRCSTPRRPRKMLLKSPLQIWDAAHHDIKGPPFSFFRQTISLYLLMLLSIWFWLLKEMKGRRGMKLFLFLCFGTRTNGNDEKENLLQFHIFFLFFL